MMSPYAVIKEKITANWHPDLPMVFFLSYPLSIQLRAAVTRDCSVKPRNLWTALSSKDLRSSHSLLERDIIRVCLCYLYPIFNWNWKKQRWYLEELRLSTGACHEISYTYIKKNRGKIFCDKLLWAIIHLKR